MHLTKEQFPGERVIDGEGLLAEGVMLMCLDSDAQAVDYVPKVNLTALVESQVFCKRKPRPYGVRLSRFLLCMPQLAFIRGVV